MGHAFPTFFLGMEIGRGLSAAFGMRHETLPFGHVELTVLNGGKCDRPAETPGWQVKIKQQTTVPPPPFLDGAPSPPSDTVQGIYIVEITEKYLHLAFMGETLWPKGSKMGTVQ